jgi:hypothetical protein
MTDNQITSILTKHLPINIAGKIMTYRITLSVYYKIKSEYEPNCGRGDGYDTIEFSLSKFNISPINPISIPFTYLYLRNTGHPCCIGYGRYKVNDGIIENQDDIRECGDTIVYYNIYDITDLKLETTVDEYLKKYVYDLVAYNKNTSRIDNRNKCYKCNNTTKKTNRSYKSLCKSCRTLKFIKNDKVKKLLEL